MSVPIVAARRSWLVVLIGLAMMASAVVGCRVPIGSGDRIAAEIQAADTLLSNVAFVPRNPIYGGDSDAIHITFAVDASDQDIVRVYCRTVEPRIRGLFNPREVLLFRPPHEGTLDGWLSLNASLPDCSLGEDAPLPTQRCGGESWRCVGLEPGATPPPRPS